MFLIHFVCALLVLFFVSVINLRTCFFAFVFTYWKVIWRRKMEKKNLTLVSGIYIYIRPWNTSSANLFRQQGTHSYTDLQQY